MKTLSFEQLEAKTARERDTNLFKSDLEMVLGQPLKGFKRQDRPGFFEGIESALKMLIADLAPNLDWRFDEKTQNITVKGYNFNCAFALQSIGLIAERWGKEPKISTKDYMYKRKPESCTRHLKFGLWFKAIKDGLVKVENDKVLKLTGFAVELGKEDLPVYIEFDSDLYNLKRIDGIGLYEWPEKLKPLAPNKLFRLRRFKVFDLQNQTSGRYDCTNETTAFIQFYHQITGK